MHDHIYMILYVLLIPLHADTLCRLGQTVHIHINIKKSNLFHIRNRIQNIFYINIETVLIQPDMMFLENCRTDCQRMHWNLCPCDNLTKIPVFPAALFPLQHFKLTRCPLFCLIVHLIIITYNIVCAARSQFLHHTDKSLYIYPVIPIDDFKICPPGFLYPPVNCRTMPAVFLRNQAEAVRISVLIFFSYCSRTVRRAVIYNQHFYILQYSFIQKRIQCLP